MGEGTATFIAESPDALDPKTIASFLAALCRGRSVEVIGQQSARLAEALGGSREIVARPTMLEDEDSAAEMLISIDPPVSRNIVERVGDFAVRACALLASDWPEEVQDRFRHAFPYVTHFACRPVQGSLIVDADKLASRILPLANSRAGGARSFHLWVGSHETMPKLGTGLFEALEETDSGETGTAGVHSGPESAWSVRHLFQPSRGVPVPVVPPPTFNAVGLAERLVKVEERTVELRRNNTRLASELRQSHSSAPSFKAFFDVPKAAHPWPLAGNPALQPADLGLYDRRVDDPVVLAGRAGEAFLSAFRLLDGEPDYAGAVAALNQLSPSLSSAREGEVPDVSIIIPVYGQLGYTLNCLDSLLRHVSRFSAEILVIDDCSPDEVTALYGPQLKAIRYIRQPKNGGFIASCNAGGQLARGRSVLMLNNDTRVVTGWLDALLGSFATFPRAGLVGSKMCYADGSLQEAGGILWRDGTAWNYGRNDDPNRPQYCYARRVDYISGCSLVVPKDLWDDLGGFDPHFTPAYAEDADLCQRVAARGREVWYQPQSRVVHYEGKTSGTSTGGGVKAYQVVNLKKLFLRWRERFESHRPNGEAPFLERERSVRKRFLFVDAVTPTPNQDAGSVQTVLALRCAREIGYKAHFVPQDNWLFEPGYTTELQAAGIDCAYAPYELGFDNYLRRYGWLFDAVIVFRVGVMSKVIDSLRTYAPKALLIFHVADLHFLRLERQARLEGSPEALSAATELKRLELDMVRRSDCTVTHSTVEASILADETAGSPVVVWPLMMDFEGSKIPFEARRDICFLGGYRHPPNVDAVLHFVDAIFPLIKRRYPDMRFIIAGANPTGEILDLAREDILVTGIVDDLRDVFDAVRVFVCPLRVGAGAKGKIMSALSYGLPIVSTAIGVEGAGLEEGKHIVVADTPEEIAAAICELYGDRDRWEAMSRHGQDLIREEFSTEMGKQRLAEVIETAYRHKLGLSEAV